MNNDTDLTKREALEELLKTVSQPSAKGMIAVSALLGIMAMIPGLHLPAALSLIAGGIGIEALGTLLDRTAYESGNSNEEIITLIRQALSEESTNQLTPDSFFHGLSLIRRGQHNLKDQNETIYNLIKHVHESLEGIDFEKMESSLEQLSRIDNKTDEMAQNFDEITQNLLKALERRETTSETQNSQVTSEVETYYRMGNMFVTQKNYNKAIEMYRQATNLDPSHVKSFFNLALAYEESGDLRQAIQTYERAFLARHQASAISSARLNLAHMYKAMGQIEEALETAFLAIIEYPLSSYTYLFIGKLFAEENDFTKARFHLKRALDIANQLGEKQTATMAQLEIQMLENESTVESEKRAA